MRAPLSWIKEYVDLPAGVTGHQLATRLIALGLEVETVDSAGEQISGPLVVGRVLEFSAEPQKNGKTIRWNQVDVGEGDARGIVCGASNYEAGDLVVVALPGTVLPGGFEIGARKTYGHVSDGMICSARELGVGEDHDGILVLSGVPVVGAGAVDVLGLADEVLDIAVTPDRSYALSIRGIAREAATAYDVAFHDPARAVAGLTDDGGGNGGAPHGAEILDGADRIVLRTLTGFDPMAPSPQWMQSRLVQCGMRPLSLAVDVTNYVMLELGQPLHAFDRDRLTGDRIVVRRAVAGEQLETLDHVVRTLDGEDAVIADGSGDGSGDGVGRSLALAGVMGGLDTEIDETSSAIVIEAAHFFSASIARTSRRHRLSSEASRRFERGVDAELGPVASARAVALLVEHGGAAYVGSSEVDCRDAVDDITLELDRPARTAGLPIDHATVVTNLERVGAHVARDGSRAVVTPPPWRPDLSDPADLDEEVIRLVGYDNVPAVLPIAPAGRGLTAAQRLRRRIGVALAGAGYVESPSHPFISAEDLDALLLPEDDVRRATMRLANPLSDEAPLLRTTLLPGLLDTMRRNVSRGTHDLALFELAAVVRPGRLALPHPPRPPVTRRPTAEEEAALDAALPHQPLRVGVIVGGARESSGWWGTGRTASWADAVEAARIVARAARVDLEIAADQHAPWHPGRCAVLRVGDTVVGHAGELHPRVVAAWGLPERTSAMELDLDLLGQSSDPVPAPRLSMYPVATQDVALVVDASVPAAAVEAALRAGAGDLLEDLRLFDVYRGEQIEDGQASLAFALRFRAPDRTLTADEVSAARESAVAEAGKQTGAVPRG